MSGGSMDYISYRIEEYSADLCDRELTDLAKDMAEVYHDAEWWHSGEICEETYRKTVAKFKKKWLGSDRELRLKGYVNEIKEFCDDFISPEEKEDNNAAD